MWETSAVQQVEAGEDEPPFDLDFLSDLLICSEY